MVLNFTHNKRTRVPHHHFISCVLWLHLQCDRVRDVHADESGDGFARLASATKKKRKEKEGEIEEGQGGREEEMDRGRDGEREGA
jgi:hypothetical protein